MEIKYQYCTTDEAISAALDDLERSYVLGVDTETTGLDPHTSELLLLQIGNERMNYVIDMTRDHALTQKNREHSIWIRIIQLFVDPSRTKIAANWAFDWKILKAFFGCEVQNLFDVLLAERILTAGKAFGEDRYPSLKTTAPKYTQYTRDDMDKEIRKGFYSGYRLEEFSQDQLEYSARDIDVLLPMFYGQIAALAAGGMTAVAELEFKVAQVTASMEFVGVNLDVETWRVAIQEINVERVEKRRKVERAFKEARLEKQKSLFDDFCTISIDSPKQLLEALKGLGIPAEDTTGKEAIEKLAREHPHFVLETLLEYRAQQKLMTSYGPSLIAKINPVTGRIHGQFFQIGADTGRYSSREPNLQNIPGDQKCVLRDCFVAPPGFVALGADFSQQELRVVAALSNETNMIAAYLKKEDLHAWTTALIFEWDFEELKEALKAGDKKAKSQRNASKSSNFLIVYGGTFKRLSAQARITEEFAKEVMDKHAKAFPKLQQFIQIEGDKIIQQGYSTTMLGRKRFYVLPDPADERLYRKAEAGARRQGINHMVQGASADITKLAAYLTHVRFTKQFGKESAYIWALVHDEIQTFVREELLEEAKQVLERSMKDAFYTFIPETTCPIEVDIKHGAHWVH
jgi:DNA polymerase I